jgi:hypothetical protein
MFHVKQMTFRTAGTVLAVVCELLIPLVSGTSGGSEYDYPQSYPQGYPPHYSQPGLTFIPCRHVWLNLRPRAVDSIHGPMPTSRKAATDDADTIQEFGLPVRLLLAQTMVYRVGL